MKKYTFKDFLDGKVDVRCENDEQKKAFLKVCAKHGLLWHHGDKADAFMPAFSIISTKGFNDGRLGHTWHPVADACVGFDEIDLSTAPRYQIVIESDGDTTTAKMIVNGKEVNTTTAKRNPADKPNWHIGAQVAFERLWEKKEKPEKPAEKDGFKVGDRVVCVASSNGNHDVVGKHGTVVDADDLICLGVEFDEYVNGNELSLSRLPLDIKKGHGWWCRPEMLRHEQPTKPKVREVHRKAKKDEWVRIVNKIHCTDCRYKNGDVLRVVREGDCLDDLSCGGAAAHFAEYVVLEGYQPGRDGK